jgi:hypothetical protein
VLASRALLSERKIVRAMHASKCPRTKDTTTYFITSTISIMSQSFVPRSDLVCRWNPILSACLRKYSLNALLHKCPAHLTGSNEVSCRRRSLVPLIRNEMPKGW